MIIDCRTWKTEEDVKRERRRVFVDGIEVLQVFYLDTHAGFVQTYDVLGDGKVHATREQIPVGILENSSEPWDMPENGAMSKIVRGKVELLPFPETV